MKTPSQIVWEAHGSPEVDGCVEADGRCYVCAGELTCGMRTKDVLGKTFTDHTRVRNPSGSHICVACCYVMSRTSSVLGRDPGKCAVCKGTLQVVAVPKTGRAKSSKVGDDCQKCNGTGMQSAGGNFRNVSHLWEQGWSGKQAPCYQNCSKGEKPAMRAFIERDHQGPWFAALGDSGQKHVLPFAQLNGSGRAGAVLFDEQVVQIPNDTSLISSMVDLLTVGTTKAEIESGRFGDYAWRRCEERIRAFEVRNKSLRGTPWFTFAIWLAQRDEAKVQERLAREKEERDAKRSRKGTARRNRVSAGGAEQSLHANARAQGVVSLAAVRSSPAPEPERSGNNGTVAGEDPKRTQDREHAQQQEQLGLFRS